MFSFSRMYDFSCYVSPPVTFAWKAMITVSLPLIVHLTANALPSASSFHKAWAFISPRELANRMPIPLALAVCVT